MAIHSSILAWRVSWTEKPGGLQSTESQRDTIERLPLRLQGTILANRDPGWGHWLGSSLQSGRGDSKAGAWKGDGVNPSH